MLPSIGVSFTIAWAEYRVIVLRKLLADWIAEFPAVQACDAERARHHQEAIADLRQLIAELEAQAALPATSRSVERSTDPDEVFG